VQWLTGHKDQQAVKTALDTWFGEAKKARWTSASAVRRSYATASIDVKRVQHED
jgi:hypothetical protein